MRSGNILEIKNLQKSYMKNNFQNKVLDNINLSIGKGKFVIIMGPSGSGKSTLLNILGLLDDASSGKYVFEGKNVENLTDKEKSKIRHENIGFVFQNYNLLSHLTAEENVVLPLFLSSETNLTKRKRASRTLLERVKMSHRKDYLPKELSGGEKQRIAIARSLINDPKVIFADEPTGSVDSKSELNIINLFEEIVSKGTSVVLVTHNNIYKKYADELWIMHEGKLVNESGDEVETYRSTNIK